MQNLDVNGETARKLYKKKKKKKQRDQIKKRKIFTILRHYEIDIKTLK